MKSFKYLAAAALTLLAVGCNKEQVTEVPDGQMVDVTFTAALPGEMATKALGDGQTAKNLYVSVYENDADKTKLDLDKTATFTDLKTQVKFSLVKGKTYNFVFWTQAEDAPYDVTDLKNIKVKNYTTDANDEKRDAFYATRKELKVNGALTETIKLYRPFAQVNFATADYAEAQKAGFSPAVSSFTASGAATTFDTFAAEGKDEVAVALTETNVPADILKTLDGKTYTRLAMNYLIPVGKQGESHNIDVAATFKANNGEAVTVSAPNAPVQNNYRTNILGNLLTSQVIFNVEIVPIFNEPDNDIDIVNVKDEASLRALFATGGEAKLADDLVLDESIAVKAGKEVVLDLNGKTVKNNSNSSAFDVYGSLVINGEGTVDGGEGGDNVAVWSRSGGKLTINGGTYTVGADANGSGNSTIYSTGGDVVINGGTFSTAAKYRDQYWTINKQNNTTGKVEIYGGTFPGFDPANPNTDDDDTYVAEGYVSVEKDGVWTVLPGAKDVAAIKAVFKEGGTIALVNDLVLDRSLSVSAGKEVTLDLNGHKISNSVDLWDDLSCVISVDGGTLTIKGEGGVAAKANDCYTFNVRKGGKLVIEDGEYVGNVSVIQVQEGLAEVSGGKFSLIQTWPGVGNGYDYTINLIDAAGKDGTANAIVSGGCFYKFDPSDNNSENPKKNHVADGYKSTLVGDYYVVTKEGVTPVASQEGFEDVINNGSVGTPIEIQASPNSTIVLKTGLANEGDNARNITIVGDGSQTVDVISGSKSAEGGMLSYQRGSSFTFKNLKIKAGEGNFDGVVCNELVFENCTITGKLTLFGKATFKDCVFENTMANQYSIWTWGGTDVTFDKCTFNTNGKAILLYGKATEAKPTNLIVTNCTLNDRKNGAAGKAAIEIGNDYNATYSLTIANCTVNGFAEGKNTGSKLWANKNSMDAEHLSVTIDGTKVQ